MCIRDRIDTSQPTGLLIILLGYRSHHCKLSNGLKHSHIVGQHSVIDKELYKVPEISAQKEKKKSNHQLNLTKYGILLVSALTRQALQLG